MSSEFVQVDAHHHFWDLNKFEYPDFPPEGTVLRKTFLIPELEDAIKSTPIRKAIFIQVSHSYEENEWVLKLVESCDTVVGVVAWVDLTDPKVGDLLDKLKAHPKFCGIRHLTHNEADHNWLLREDVQRGLAILEEKNVAFDLLLKPPNLPAIPTLAAKFPKLKMVIDHIAKPYIKDGILEPWKEQMSKCAEFPNVFVKLSGLVTEADMSSWTTAQLQPYASHIISAFGCNRVMYGSDWPVCMLAADTYSKVHQSYFDLAVGAGCGEDDLRRIFHDTALSFYGRS